MIRTNWTRTDGESVSSDTQKGTVLGAWALGVLSLVAATILTGIFKSQSLTPPDVFLWRPLLVVVACLFGATVWALASKRDPRQIGERVFGSLPLAAVGGLLAGLLGFWPQAIISAPLSLVDALKYVATLGIAVTATGPDGFLRGTVWFLAAAVGFWTWRERKDLVASAGFAILTWLTMTLILIAPSFVLWIHVGVMESSVLGDGTRMLMDFSRLNMGSYWTNLQLLRWFTGFGDQLATSYALFVSAWVWVLGVVVWSLWQARKWWLSVWRKTDWREITIVVFALAVGMAAAWSRAGWSAIDVAAWLVWILLVIMLAAWSFTGDLEPADGFWFFAVWGAAVLGWPILMVLVVVVTARHAFQTVRDPNASWVLGFAKWLGFGILALAFARRGVDVGQGSVRLLAAGMLLLLPMALARRVEGERGKEWLLGTWLAVAACVSLALWTWAALVLAFLAVVVSEVVLRVRPHWDRFLPWFIYLFAWLMLFFLVVLPRMLNPRLLPMQ